MPSVTGDALAGDATKLTKNAQNTAKPSSSLHQVMQRYAPQRQWVEWSRCSRARTSPCSRQRRWEQRKHVFAALKGWLLAARLGVHSGNRLHLPRTKLLARTSKNILTHTSCYAPYARVYVCRINTIPSHALAQPCTTESNNLAVLWKSSCAGDLGWLDHLQRAVRINAVTLPSSVPTT